MSTSMGGRDNGNDFSESDAVTTYANRTVEIIDVSNFLVSLRHACFITKRILACSNLNDRTLPARNRTGQRFRTISVDFFYITRPKSPHVVEL